MNNFGDVLKISLTNYSELFFSCQTYSIQFGKSDHFLFRKLNVASLIDGSETSIIERDINSFVQMTRRENRISFQFFWLRSAGTAVSGHTDTFDIPIEKACRLFNDEPIHTVIYNTDQLPKARIHFSDCASRTISRIRKDKHALRALCKLLRDRFDWGATEEVRISADFGDDLFFSSGSMVGGIILHKSMVVGRDGKKHPSYAYQLHT